ncbi:MAG TPA: ArsI/CadI family heavy metal resistance metalloenzyme [Candidatus Acidoferrales bacterium]|nr:ArsI/CadI family heavy metal resistance metalloenzyme [Candidatus Acidoferrales bacterium]
MKIHLNLATADLERSVAFYSTLLDAAPAKVFEDYALFVTERPALELALDLRESAPLGSGAHYGICVDDAAEVERAISRLDARGLVASIEREEICCYANQTKVWAVDPDGRPWEVYTVHADTAEESVEAACCSNV